MKVVKKGNYQVMRAVMNLIDRAFASENDNINPDIKISLTGSRSLKLLGLINRPCDDYDIIVGCGSTQIRDDIYELLKKHFTQEGLTYEYLETSVFQMEYLGAKIDLIISADAPKISPVSGLLPFDVLTPSETFKIKNTYTPKKTIADLKNVIGSLLQQF